MAKSKLSGDAESELGPKRTFFKLTLVLLLCAPTAHSSGEVAGPGGVVVRDGPRAESHHSSFDTPSDAPFGFFVDGSSIPGLNGMYGPKLPHRGTDGAIEEVPSQLAGNVHLGAYRHDSSGWWLVNLIHGVGPDATGGPEWVFIDPTWRHRFRLPGDGPVPGYGPAWSHIHKDFDDYDDLDDMDDETVASLRDNNKLELPRLLGPIPDDHNDCVTSFMFEQLLVQLVRQRSAVAQAKVIRTKKILNASSLPAHTCPAMMAACPSATNTTHAGYEAAAQALMLDSSFKEAAECLGAAAWTSSSVESAAEIFLRQATVARWARDFDSAVDAARAVLGSCSGPDTAAAASAKPSNSRTLLGRAHLALGRIHLDSGRLEDALEALELAYAALVTIEGEEAEGTSDEVMEQLERLLMMTVTASRRLHPPVPRLVAPPVQEKAGCVLVRVGTHFRVWPGGVKTLFLNIPEGTRCPERVDRSNWLGDETFDQNAVRHVFHVRQSTNAPGNSMLEISRLPEDGVNFTQGWPVDINFHCCNTPLLDAPPAAGAGAVAANGQNGHLRHHPPTYDDPHPSEPDPASPKPGLSDHYYALQLPRDFQPDQLKHSYRKMSRTHHPDKPGGSVEQFELISAAHDCLSDDICREDFDSGVDLGRAARDNAAYTLKQEVEQIYFPERYPFHPFGDPAHFCRGRDCPNGPNRG